MTAAIACQPDSTSMGTQTVSRGGSRSLQAASVLDLCGRLSSIEPSFIGVNSRKFVRDGWTSPSRMFNAWRRASNHVGPLTTNPSVLKRIRANSRTAGQRGSVIRMFSSKQRQVLKDGVPNHCSWALAIVGLDAHCCVFKTLKERTHARYHFYASFPQTRLHEWR